MIARSTSRITYPPTEAQLSEIYFCIAAAIRRFEQRRAARLAAQAVATEPPQPSVVAGGIIHQAHQVDRLT